jgi:outer membrane protein assembly factor BamD (BamD/ComL family)
MTFIRTFPALITLLAIVSLTTLAGCDQLKPAGQSNKSNAPGAKADDYSKGLDAAEAHLYKDALPLLTKALEENPDDKRAGTAMYYLALSHQETEDKGKAIAAYKAFIKNFPKHDKVATAKKNLAKKFAVTVD